MLCCERVPTPQADHRPPSAHWQLGQGHPLLVHPHCKSIFCASTRAAYGIGDGENGTLCDVTPLMLPARLLASWSFALWTPSYITGCKVRPGWRRGAMVPLFHSECCRVCYRLRASLDFTRPNPQCRWARPRHRAAQAPCLFPHAVTCRHNEGRRTRERSGDKRTLPCCTSTPIAESRHSCPQGCL